MKKMSEKKKKNITRVIMLILAVIMIMSFVILPLGSSVGAEEDNSAVTVSSFETGKLSEAIEKAKDGTDLNLIKKIAVKGGTMNAADYSALCGYPNVEYLELAGSDTENGVIPENALQSRNALTYISLPANTETIGARAFSGNRTLVKISIPAALRVIGEYAFEGCEKVEEFIIPAEVTSIGTGAFSDCKALKEFALPEAVTAVPDYCFSKCSFTELHLGPQVTKIGDGAFSDCHGLADIYFYGREPFSANESAFQNLKVTIHTYEDAKGFDKLKSNFVSVNNDLSEDSVYVPPKTAAPAAGEIKQEETSAETSSNEETSETSNNKEVPETKKNEETTETEKTPVQSSETSSAAAEQAVPASSSSAFSGLSVLIICILCTALAVTVTLLVVKRKK